METVDVGNKDREAVGVGVLVNDKKKTGVVESLAGENAVETAEGGDARRENGSGHCMMS